MAGTAETSENKGPAESGQPEATEPSVAAEKSGADEQPEAAEHPADTDEAAERRRLGERDNAVEDALVEEFENTVTEGANRLNRTWRALVVTGLFGGIDVGLGLLAMLAVVDATGSKLLGGLAFGIGLYALRLAHSELFTEEFLVPINAIMAGHGTWPQLLRLWAVTLVTNLAGGWAFTWVVIAAFPRFEDVLRETTASYLDPGLTLETGALAVLAGFTITLVTRMSQGSNEGIATLANALISGLLVVGLGMLHGALGSVVVFASMHAGDPTTYLEWLVWFSWVIPLNMVGGLVILTLPRLVRTWELSTAERQAQRREREQEGAGRGRSRAAGVS